MAVAEVRQGSKGLRAAGNLLKLYANMLLPVAIVAANFFGVFAAMSYLVPSVLCTESVKINAGVQKGFADCAYVIEGDYRHGTGKKLPWLFFWAVQQMWLVFFPATMGWAMFGKTLTRVDTAIVYTLVATTGLAVFIGGAASNLPLNHSLFFSLPTCLATIVTITVAIACCRYSGGNRVNIARWIILFTVAGVVLTIYFFIIPMIVTKRATPNQLLLVRLVVHPIVWNVMTVLFMHTASHIGPVPNLMQVTFLVWPEIYKAVFGRFLLLQLSGVGNVLIINLILVLKSGVSPNQRAIWVGAFTQIVTTLFTDFVGLAIDWKFHQLDYFSHLVKNMKRFLFFILFVTTLGGLRLALELLLLFCPSYVPGVGVLLEYCNKPSLFDGIGS
ncbi:hypothetical protein WJX72_007636 [[Myrmecia] bisecta]|uniref:Uncharacterized protein n=1 Tax=[Myrmecia] bisecta TaxID=41462 RepID=A0AAW1Q995_9CHLO